jgi:hypothetical protein
VSVSRSIATVTRRQNRRTSLIALCFKFVGTRGHWLTIPLWVMNLDLTEEETGALTALLKRVISERNHLGTPSNIKSDWWVTSSRIRGRLRPELAASPSEPFLAISRRFS